MHARERKNVHGRLVNLGSCSWGHFSYVQVILQWSLDAWRKRSDINGEKLAIPEKDSKAQPILALLGGDFLLVEYVQNYLHFHFAIACCFDLKGVTMRKVEIEWKRFAIIFIDLLLRFLAHVL